VRFFSIPVSSVYLYELKMVDMNPMKVMKLMDLGATLILENKSYWVTWNFLAFRDRFAALNA
jgi:hypothetical protein